MTIPLRSRTDFKNAGKQMASEAVAILAAHLESLSVEELEDMERIDGLAKTMLDAMEGSARSYRALGYPPLWVEKFRSAFTRTAGEQCRALGFRALPVAGHA